MMKYRKLRGRLTEMGMTQKNLADALGITVQTLSAKINGHRDFKLPEVRTVCTVLNIAPSDIAIFFDVSA